MRSLHLCLAAAVLFVSGAALAEPDYLKADAKGGKDSPVISRYAGSVLFKYQDENLALLEFPVSSNGKWSMEKVEGRASVRAYYGPDGRNAREVWRNYEDALKKGGYEILGSCDPQTCWGNDTHSKVRNLPRAVSLATGSTMSNWLYGGEPDSLHYVTGRRLAGGQTTYVLAAVVNASRYDKEVFGRTQQFIQVVQPAQAETGKVTVDAKTITDTLKREGRIALYGVLFDTGKASLKPESKEALDEMAKALKADAKARVYIVGHTDNQGAMDGNVVLSQKRAEAVVEALRRDYGIAADRLLAKGVADFSPVASNAEEGGRAKNRRVEMVLR